MPMYRSGRKTFNQVFLSLTRYATVGFSLALALAMNGCATVSHRQDKVAGFPLQTLSVKGKVYFPLVDVCSYLKIECDYDALGRQISLRKADTEVKLLLDSSMILVNGSALDIEEPVVLTENGVAAVPLQFKARVLDRFYCQLPLNEPQESVLPLRIRRVVVDAGHGGHDPGAIGRTGLREKDVNLDIAKRLSSLLRTRGIDVVMTRPIDTFISLEKRADIANRANADLFISVHSNSARTSGLNGFEVYYVSEKMNDVSRALAAAKTASLDFSPGSFYNSSLDLKVTLWDILYTQNRAESIVLAQNICQEANRGIGVKILGVKGARFSVLRGTRIPGVLVEVGFLSHPTEERRLRNGFYRQQVAEALCSGIINYGRQYDLASATYK
ncbi:MAG: hypothetical protein A2Y00_02225 [Omnitrophica WOR_2 bacterium GWF2_43_52]|nr:MAG: hypothetical protein A2062_00025 [Omnitrophica WOR_2 bacterium GWA2_44_7]OGX22163.1 MAG: hypothetical protein A2Y00_02225 [Omnitrophica WOR_2 bacterium GWF2_43_52]HAH20636.1 hypothetical protein [Candidatus Omnitrophota bacterium]HBG63554.1 hypothetical protein [Candidatus Omnitrophota bacterium]